MSDQPPLGMRREEAAYYFGFSNDLAEFEEAVAAGIIPKARLLINGVPYWDRRELDRAFEALPIWEPET